MSPCFREEFLVTFAGDFKKCSISRQQETAHKFILLCFQIATDVEYRKISSELAEFIETT